MQNNAKQQKLSVIIIGAGGHGRVIADLLNACCCARIKGFIDDSPKSSVIDDLPILGKIAELGRIINSLNGETSALIVGIGDNSMRNHIVSQITSVLVRYNARFLTVKHPSASVSSSVSLGEGTVIIPQAAINTNAVIGNHAIINTSSSVDHDCIIGDFAHISPGVHLAGGVQVGEDAHVGIGACVLPGVQIGKWSVIGAGSVVTRDIPERVVAYGVPAKVQRVL